MQSGRKHVTGNGNEALITCGETPGILLREHISPRTILRFCRPLRRSETLGATGEIKVTTQADQTLTRISTVPVRRFVLPMTNPDGHVVYRDSN